MSGRLAYLELMAALTGSFALIIAMSSGEEGTAQVRLHPSDSQARARPHFDFSRIGALPSEPDSFPQSHARSHIISTALFLSLHLHSCQCLLPPRTARASSPSRYRDSLSMAVAIPDRLEQEQQQQQQLPSQHQHPPPMMTSSTPPTTPSIRVHPGRMQSPSSAAAASETIPASRRV